ncbi:hypothetical protein Rhal01_02463 [Rubritalea halochordaticola]|uniref:Calcineurin-like phosphoesterase domain-containing protein n=2 Tax=Rubritalea halochordaticola TaxID=714537 RepID=A0ABP9V2S3_9BACT
MFLTGCLCAVAHSSLAKPFEMVIMPDTQNYFTVIREGGPDLFTNQTEWIRDHVKKENIVFVTHVGDVILDRKVLWEDAGKAMSLLDGAVPYSVTFGNHDGGAPGTFTSARYKDYPWYLGGSDDSMAHAQQFRAEGITFLHLNLPHNPKPKHLDWAKGMLEKYKGKPTIISTHGYMADNSKGRSGNGNRIWNTLIDPYPQVFMTCNGHDWVSRHEVDTTSKGRKVLQIQSNWQQSMNGGNGFLQRVVFEPEKNQIRVETYSPFIDAYHTDYSGAFAYQAKFSKSGIEIGEELVAPMKTWSGKGQEGKWSDGGSWGGDAPQEGDLLVFGAQASGALQNDLASGTSFAGVVFQPGRFSGKYAFSGNGITLTGDVVNMGTYGPKDARSGPKWDLPIKLEGDRQFNTGDWDMVINGEISGDGSLTKTHGRDYFRGSYDGRVYIGDLYLTQENSYTGNTRVTGGALVLEHAESQNIISGSPVITVDFNCLLKVDGLKEGTFVLAQGQTLRGHGKVLGKLNAGKETTVYPGRDKVTGSLLIKGDVSLAADSLLNIRMAGSGPEQADSVQVEGTVKLDGATLNLAGIDGYKPKSGDHLVIIQNDGDEAVSGQFVSGAGSQLNTGTTLPEGATISRNFLGSGRAAKISYKGGDGNDVSIAVQ